jgi:perosamine synthetase
LARPSIGEPEKRAVLDVLDSGWLTHGPYNTKFERMLAAYVGVEHAVSMNSCASALEIALRVNDVRGEVVVPSFTFVASANAIVRAGATPVFCDVACDTRNVTRDLIAECLSPRTEAVMVVHFGGQPCNMDEIGELCHRKGLLLVEDSAETLGARWNGKQAGSAGVGCFSFFPTKNITTGEGGMLTSNDSEMVARARTLIGHGIPASTLSRRDTEMEWQRTAVVAGCNLRMSNLLAAIGCCQMEKLDSLNERRRKLASAYTQRLGERGLPVEPPRVAEQAEHTYQMYTVTLDPELRGEVLAYLRSSGVGASVHFDPPVHRQEFYGEHYPSRFPLEQTERLSRSIMTLPMFPDMSQDQVDEVVNTLEQALGQRHA